MFCSRCGTPLGEGARFCQSCGGVVHVIVTAPEEATQDQRPPKKHSALGTTFGAASLTLGILSLVLFSFAGVSLCMGAISFGLGIAGVNVSKRRNAGNGLAVAGIVCSSILFVIWLFVLTLVVLLFRLLSLGA